MEVEKEKRRRLRKRLIQKWIEQPKELAVATGLELDPWQDKLLLSKSDLLLCNVHRQGGKSLAAALLIIHEILQPDKTIVILSASERQSKLLFKSVLKLWRSLGKPVKYASVQRTYLELQNGSQVYALPSNPDTIRGISSVSLLVVDEASVVANEVHTAISPMLAISNGRTVCLFTPNGVRLDHWLYKLWTEDETAERIQVAATECKRIKPEWLKKERDRIGAFWFDQEFMNKFNDSVTKIFKPDDVKSAFDENLEYDYGLFEMVG